MMNNEPHDKIQRECNKILKDKGWIIIDTGNKDRSIIYTYDDLPIMKKRVKWDNEAHKDISYYIDYKHAEMFEANQLVYFLNMVMEFYYFKNHQHVIYIIKHKDDPTIRVLPVDRYLIDRINPILHVWQHPDQMNDNGDQHFLNDWLLPNLPDFVVVNMNLDQEKNWIKVYQMTLEYFLNLESLKNFHHF